ncbi:metallophosphoesterase family protein [Paenibacillus prosopidis]|uniref:Calcineurin-like phosphoesterase family protein n=1 Tax=Paenibacillus prosopidis TaxID=630520 RepID=A0A368WB65_9BACL|nr:metallophosphoesterase [Paenibacillus prosopidis]RCW51958.1 calcineurin-like phosphoesterase family protein [Paenibacillus prosopidis]
MMKLVLMGDLHYHEIDKSIPGLREARTAFYHTLLGRFLDMDADLHISLGDLTNFGSTLELQEVYELLQREDRTFIHVLGNHDLYWQTRREVLEITGQQRYHAIDTETAMLVFLDTAKEMDFEDWGGWLDDEQLQWLEGMVKASGTKPLLVFGHHPVYNTTARSEKEKGSIHPSIDMWRILNRKVGIGVYFNGHTHVDSIVAQNNWTFVQLSACLDQHGFRIVELTEEELRISAVDITDEEVLDNAPMLHQHMVHFTHNPNARGTDADREHVVPLLTAAQPQ